MLDKLKILLGIKDNSKDDLLSLLLDIAQDEATNYCNLTQYTTALDSIVLKMAAQLFNKNGNEGISSVSYSGVGESYLENYSSDILSALKKHRKILTV